MRPCVVFHIWWLWVGVSVGRISMSGVLLPEGEHESLTATPQMWIQTTPDLCSVGCSQKGGLTACFPELTFLTEQFQSYPSLWQIAECNCNSPHVEWRVNYQTGSSPTSIIPKRWWFCESTVFQLVTNCHFCGYSHSKPWITGSIVSFKAKASYVMKEPQNRLQLQTFAWHEATWSHHIPFLRLSVREQAECQGSSKPHFCVWCCVQLLSVWTFATDTSFIQAEARENYFVESQIPPGDQSSPK